MAKVYFRYGAMSASKSANLLMSAHNYEERGMKTVLFNFSKDVRFGEGVVASRVGINKASVPFDSRTDFFAETKTRAEDGGAACIFVDEAQFLKKEQVFQLTEIADKLRIPVICYGLRTDFRGDLFEGATWLLAWADSIEEIKTICWCNRKATFNARVDRATGRMITEGEQMKIGAEDYISLCRNHWKERKTDG